MAISELSPVITVVTMVVNHFLVPSGKRLQFANWKMAIEIVDFPIKNSDFP